jgi:hypothetical protein
MNRHVVAPGSMRVHPRLRISGAIPMMDAVMMAIGFACFAVSIAYVYACDRL